MPTFLAWSSPGFTSFFNMLTVLQDLYQGLRVMSLCWMLTALVRPLAAIITSHCGTLTAFPGLYNLLWDANCAWRTSTSQHELLRDVNCGSSTCTSLCGTPIGLADPLPAYCRKLAGPLPAFTSLCGMLCVLGKLLPLLRKNSRILTALAESLPGCTSYCRSLTVLVEPILPSRTNGGC